MAKAKYLPARLMRGKVWYIVFYQTDPVDGIRYRHRNSYDLNRIKKVTERLKAARLIIEDLNGKIPHGYPYIGGEEKIEWLHKPLFEAMQKGCDYSNLTGKKKSKQTRQSSCNNFLRWLSAKHPQLTVGKFSQKYAREYLDWRIGEERVSNKTRNTDLQMISRFWNELVSREFIIGNPFEKIDYLRTMERARRPLTEQEQKAVLQIAARDHYGVLLAIRYLWYCGLRPGEIRDLKVIDHDLKAGKLRLTGKQTKNGKAPTVPIPTIFLEYLREKVDTLPPSWYIIGKGLKPGATQCGKNTINRHHHFVLDKCIEEKIIHDKEGITFYKWKDTVGKFLIENDVNILSVKKFWRHSDIKTTHGYFADFAAENPQVEKTLNRLI